MCINQNKKAPDVIINAIAYVVENPEKVTQADIQWAKDWINSLRNRKGLNDLRDYPELMNFMVNN